MASYSVTLESSQLLLLNISDELCPSIYIDTVRMLFVFRQRFRSYFIYRFFLHSGDRAS